jgi:hypothetical protein
MYHIPYSNLTWTPTPSLIAVFFLVLVIMSIIILKKANSYPFKPVEKKPLPNKDEILTTAMNQLDQIKDLEYLNTTWRHRHLAEAVSLLKFLDYPGGVQALTDKTEELNRYLQGIQDKKLKALIPEAIEKAKENWNYLDTQYLSHALRHHKLTCSELRALENILVQDKIIAGPYHRYPGRLMGSPEPPQGEQDHG